MGSHNHRGILWNPANPGIVAAVGFARERYSAGGTRPTYPWRRRAVAADGGPTDFFRIRPLHWLEPAGSRDQVSHDDTGCALSETQAE